MLIGRFGVECSQKGIRSRRWQSSEPGTVDCTRRPAGLGQRSACPRAGRLPWAAMLAGAASRRDRRSPTACWSTPERLQLEDSNLRERSIPQPQSARWRRCSPRRPGASQRVRAQMISGATEGGTFPGAGPFSAGPDDFGALFFLRGGTFPGGGTLPGGIRSDMTIPAEPRMRDNRASDRSRS